ncbi:MAG: protein jag [Lachnospiraceae bacterium]|nr:protein jag [Lachnospiraceae bacterium]
MEWVEFSGKTVDDALDLALEQLQTTSDNVEYEILEEEKNGILGLFSKPARLRVRVREKELVNTSLQAEKVEKAAAEETVEKQNISDEELIGIATDFLRKVCLQMGVEATFDAKCDSEESVIYVNIVGNDMGLLIGKRGQTLDSLQYLTSLVVNKKSGTYFKVKLDTENYRERRKETLENLARNISSKVKKTKKSVALEPMNPYERRIIHATLQNDRMVETYSEGEEPNRKVVVALKKGYRDFGNKRGGYKKYNNYKRGGNYKKRNNGGYEQNGFERKESVERLKEQQPADTNKTE